MTETETLLIDMDAILVDMLDAWLDRYNHLCKTDIVVADIKEYDMGIVCKDERTLYSILNEEGFFFNMEPMPGAVACLKTLMHDGYDIVIVTQPPTNSGGPIYDKQRWIKKHFPEFSLKNMIFCSRKELVRGDLLFDDNPAHLEHWRKENPNGRLATLDWPYNKNCGEHFRGALDGSGWVNFVEFVRHTLPLK